MKVTDVKSLDSETSLIFWDDDTITVVNVMRGHFNFTKEQGKQFAKLYQETLEEVKND